MSDIQTISNPGYAGGTGKTLVDYYQKTFKVGRKVNSNADPKVFKRYELTIAECKRRGVRFLPAQVLRPIFQAADL